MRELEYIHDTEDTEVKNILFNVMKLSRKTVSMLKLTNGIILNDKPVTVRAVIKKGDRLVIRFVDKNGDIKPVKMNLDIVFEDDDILVINKPYDLPTHPSRGHQNDTLANGVCYLYKESPFIFRAINRLDRETSGLVVIAKNKTAAHKLGEQIKESKVEKVYYALCEGIFFDDYGTIEAPIERAKEGEIKRCVRDDGKYALTNYKVMSIQNGNTLLEVNPVTGRTHQIRVHLSFIGHPIVGDTLYGNKKDTRLMLHCGKMVLNHPVLNKKMEYLCNIPKEFYEKNL